MNIKLSVHVHVPHFGRRPRCPWFDPGASVTIERMPAGVLILLALFQLSECLGSSDGYVRLGEFHPYVLEGDGDVVVGGLFPLHYVAPEPDHMFTGQSLDRSCSG